MNDRLFIVLTGCLLILASCARQPVRNEPPEPADALLQAKVEAQSRRLAENKKALLAEIEAEGARAVEVSPVMPRYNPLEDQAVSFSMIDEDLKTMLYALSRSVGMNIIIDPAIDISDKPLTLNFENVPASEVLKEVLDMYDLYYRIDRTVIRVKPYDERIISLNFLDTDTTTSFDVGGDVLGAGETETASGLSGSFKLSGGWSRKGNPYDTIEQMVKQLQSRGGKSTINRAAGTLYIKDTPAVIRSVARLIDRLKRSMARQVLIEARIIEVSLSDEFQYGINWNVVRDSVASYAAVTEASWSYGQGLVMRHKNSKVDISEAAVDAIEAFGDTQVISNPVLRSKHGKPALISVGTSFTYKKSIETTTTGTGDDRTEETDVEVSTVFDGLILGVVPFIEDNGRISLLVNPIKSDVDRSSLNLEAVGAGSESIALPSVNIKEISTTIVMNDGDVIVLGGLMDTYQTEQKKRVPYLSAIPLLGGLFKNIYEQTENRELAIILNVSII
ncbi:MAG: pilus (MSHA type) biogenesis protein MshL [Thermodesulfobacteriota bacterium]|nr:pilus (MSHA type) biogenesis protein MshL [Thermodesulfobacteriota bacterium]